MHRPPPGQDSLFPQPGVPWPWRLQPPSLALQAMSKAPAHQPGGQGVMPRRWSVRPQGPARGDAVFKARAHHHGVTRGVAQAVVGASLRACEECCSPEGPGTPAKGDGESCPGTGRCLLKGLLVGLQSPRPGQPMGQGVVPRRWSVRHEALARGTLVSKARAHQPGRTGSPALVVVRAS